MFQKVITVNPWSTKLFLWYGHYDEIVRRCAKDGCEPPTGGGIAGTRFSKEWNGGIIWMSPRDALWEERCLVHELIHFVNKMFACVNLKEAEGSDEGLAYQVDHLYGELIPFIRKHHDHYEIKD